MPKISIIVPIYKVDNYLTQCLNSIVNQTFKDLEIILIDEGDQDRCREIIDDFSRNDDRIVALHEKHGGYGNSVNSGIEAATGEYIGFVESDDFIEPDMFELLYDTAVRTGADVVKSSFYNYNDDGKRDFYSPFVEGLKDKVPTDWAFSPMAYPDIFSIHPSIWAGLYKTDWLREKGIRFLPKGAYLDVKFRFDVFMATDKVAWVSKPLYHWRVTNPNSTNARWNYEGALFIWEEVHKIFDDKPTEWNIIAPIIVGKEYNNIFGRVSKYNYTDEQLNKIMSFRKKYTDEQIMSSKYLKNSEKKKLIDGSYISGSQGKKDGDNPKETEVLLKNAADEKRIVRLLITLLFTGLLVVSFKEEWYVSVIGSEVNNVCSIISGISFLIMLLVVLFFCIVAVLSMFSKHDDEQS